MMRLEDATRTVRDEGRTALVPFFTIGFPDEKTSLDLLRDIDRRVRAEAGRREAGK